MAISEVYPEESLRLENENKSMEEVKDYIKRYNNNLGTQYR